MNQGLHEHIIFQYLTNNLKTMKRISLLFSALMLIMVTSVNAVATDQPTTTDITDQYLSNADFETNPTGAATDETIYDIDGWTETPTAGALNFHKMGTVAYGSTINIGEPNDVPANGSSVTDNNTSLLVTKLHWYNNSSITVEQSATLPAGKYLMSWDSYVKQTTSNATSRCGYEIDGTATYDALPTSVDTWKSHYLIFLITESKDVIFRLGQRKTAEVGGGDSPVLYVDNLKLYSVPPGPADKTELQTLVDSATVMNNNQEAIPAGNSAYTDLNTAITTAQAVLDNSSATEMDAAIQEIAMQDAIAYVYKMIAVQEKSAVWNAGDNVTSVITNPSFEDNNFTGWTNTGMKIATSGISKDGSYYVDQWKSSGSLTNLSVKQTISEGIPNGYYKLEARAVTSEAAGGAYVFANNDSTEVFAEQDYTVKTKITDYALHLGFDVVSTSNWAGVDNFRLTYYGEEPVLEASETSLTMDVVNPTATFTIEGYNLSDGITISCPAHFSVDTANIALQNGSDLIDVLTVTVAFDKEATTSGDITISSTGANSKTIAVTGTADPVLTLSETYLTFDDVTATGTFTVNGGNLTEDITITAPTGFSVDKETVAQDAGLTTVTVTFDGNAESRGNLSIASSGISKSIRLIGFMDFTPLYSTGNLISDPSFTSLDAFDGWKNREITTDTLAVYSGRSSFFGNGNGICWDGDGFSIDYALNSTVESDTYYKLRAMVRTVDGSFNFLLNGIGKTNVPHENYSLGAFETGNIWEQFESVFQTSTVGDVALYFNSCDGEGLTGSKAYLDNYELYKMPIHLAADSIFFDGLGDSTVAVTAQLTNSDQAFAITAPAGITASAASVAADASIDITISFDNSSNTEGYVVFDNGTYADSVYVKGLKKTATGLVSNKTIEDQVFVSNNTVNAKVAVNKASEVSYKVYNLQGSLVANQSVYYTAGVHQTTLDVNISNGIYLVKITKEGQSQTFKIVK